MHKIFLIITLLITLFATFLVGKEIFKQNRGDVLNITNKSKDFTDSAFSELKKYPYFEPKLISLDSSQGSTTLISIEKVGLESDGALGVPSTWENAGWYQESARPGEEGKVIIDGHYDTDTGSPAAFWGLQNANLNDTVLLKDELGRDFTYRVVDIFYVDIQDPQRQQVLQESDEAELVLITCGGVWDPIEGTYNKRLVVRAKLAG